MAIPMTESLTRKHKQILDFISKRFAESGLYPTLREIGRRFGVSVGTIQDQVAALQAKGFVRRHEGRLARGLSLNTAASGFHLPILGRVGAGLGPIAQEDVEGQLTFKDFTSGADFALRVKGDSMVGANIVDGDLVKV